MVPPFVLSILCRGHVLVSFEGSQSAASPADQKISLTGSLILILMEAVSEFEEGAEQRGAIVPNQLH